MLEFYATITFDPTKALGDRTAISIRFGGDNRDCTAIDLSI